MIKRARTDCQENEDVARRPRTVKVDHHWKDAASNETIIDLRTPAAEPASQASIREFVLAVQDIGESVRMLCLSAYEPRAISFHLPFYRGGARRQNRTAPAYGLPPITARRFRAFDCFAWFASVVDRQRDCSFRDSQNRKERTCS
jgi:hypothetical protein